MKVYDKEIILRVDTGGCLANYHPTQYPHHARPVKLNKIAIKRKTRGTTCLRKLPKIPPKLEPFKSEKFRTPIGSQMK